MSYKWIPSGEIPYEKMFDATRYRWRYGDLSRSGTTYEKFVKAGWPCFNEDEEKWKFSTSPHIIGLAGSAFVAYSRVCITACQVSLDGTHRVRVPEHTNALEVVTMVFKFLRALSVRNKYIIEIYTPTNISNEMAFVTILTSVWKNLTGFESQIVQEAELSQVMFELFDQNQIVVNDRETVLAACLEGSMEKVHIRPTSHSNGQISRVKSQPFVTKNVLIWIKTDQAPNNTPPPRVVEEETTETIRRHLEANCPEKVGEVITEQHRLLPYNNAFRTNIDRALTDFKQVLVVGKLAHGYEVQKGGAVVLFMKPAWGSVKARMMIFSGIANTAEVDIRSITYEALIPSGGALLDPDHRDKFKNTRTVCMEFQ